MTTDVYYSTSPKGPIIYLINQDALTQDKIAHAAYLKAHQFSASLGQVCPVIDANGTMIAVYVGSPVGQTAEALGYAALMLPSGVYQLNGKQPLWILAQWALAQYRFSDFKKNKKMPSVLSVAKNELPSLLAMVDAHFLVRDLINSPANVMTPSQLSTIAAEIAHEHNAHFEEWVDEALLWANFPAIHAVGRASHHKPRLLRITSGDPHLPRITLVGKGVCFDSGGLDLKPASNMRLMKKDMGGAAHVLGLAQWILSEQLPIHLEVLIPAVENAVGSDAFRPGDIITMRNGLTVEIDNTDAEGRLILADALSKAVDNHPEVIITFATLTGAARVAVGTDIAAFFTRDDAIASALYDSGMALSDPVWRLPLYDGYKSMLDSSIADLMNASSSPYAGAITAALFLDQFVPQSIPFVHLDIMGWNLSSRPGKPEGGEALGLRAVMHYLQKTYGTSDDA